MSLRFTHLHTHTNFSLLDGAASIDALFKRSQALGMDSLAITDHGNLFGVPQFVHKAKKYGIKPIIGCEFYVTPHMHDKQNKTRYHQLILAKNKIGYQNLIKLSSMSFIDGYYYKPRVDQAHIAQHAEGLIATTCCLGSHINQTILKEGEEAAEKVFLSWLDIFQEDYYIELQRFGEEGVIRELDTCNEVLLRWSRKYGVKVMATNDVHYAKEEDALAQDIMLCLQTGKDYDDPKRMRFINNQFYLKSPDQMSELFSDVLDAVANTQEIVEKIEPITLERELLMPDFPIPENFPDQGAFLKHMTFERANKRYPVMTDAITERLQFELNTIIDMGFAGYFLIVQDIICAAKQLGVLVGPGRGSVAGSAIAYVLGITDVEPIQYNLLFERFLNPERVSMPDIDMDFDDEGRQKVIQYIVDKYGYHQVAQIVTFGSMAAKSVIRDVSRVLGVPLATADRLAKLVPDKPGTTLEEAFQEVPELMEVKKQPTTPEGRVLAISETLEGSPRHTGLHAAGVIIAPKNLKELIPLKTDKTSHLLVTQYDGSVIESVGMLKMDILGLKTLSIIRDAIKLIKKVHGKEVDIEHLPLDDPKTFAIYQKGETVGIFQFESEGMQKALQQQHPTEIEHLIAMNALYRPGPMSNMPTYIERMHGREQVDDMHPVLKEVLAPTFGIPVYQEQIMQMAQKMAGYTLGEADMLRRAMGKKKVEEMARHQAIFIEGAQKLHQVDKKKAQEIFETMSKFAQYGFNRSHAAAYTLLSYQTAYLKAHYPAAFMASVLTHNQKNLTKISFFIDECKRMGIPIEGPEINTSQVDFSNTPEGTIRFGLAAIKGVGEQIMETLTRDREKRGPFKDFHDMVYRLIEAVPDKLPNRKMIEQLAKAGVFFPLEKLHRKQYVFVGEKGSNYIQQVIQYEYKRYKENNNAQQLLFSDASPDVQYGPRPQAPAIETYSNLEKLALEKELIGFYMSGHPLDPYIKSLKALCNTFTSQALHRHDQEVRLAGMLTAVQHRRNKSGAGFALVSLEDTHGSLSLAFFGDTYQQCREYLQENKLIWLRGKIQKRYHTSEQWELKPQQLLPLEEAQATFIQGVNLHLSSSKLNEEVLKELERILFQYRGKHALHVFLHEKGWKHPCQALASSQVTLKGNLVESLEKLPGMACEYVSSMH